MSVSVNGALSGRIESGKARSVGNSECLSVCVSVCLASFTVDWAGKRERERGDTVDKGRQE